MAAVQETHFTCGVDCRVLVSDFNIFSAYGSRTSAGVSLLVGAALMLMLTLFLQVTGAGWLWPMLP